MKKAKNGVFGPKIPAFQRNFPLWVQPLLNEKFRQVVFAAFFTANSYSRPWPILICGGLSWGGLVKLPPPPPTTQLNNPNYSQVHNRTPINQEPQAFFGKPIVRVSEAQFIRCRLTENMFVPPQCCDLALAKKTLSIVLTLYQQCAIDARQYILTMQFIVLYSLVGARFCRYMYCLHVIRCNGPSIVLSAHCIRCRLSAGALRN